MNPEAGGGRGQMDGQQQNTLANQGGGNAQSQSNNQNSLAFSYRLPTAFQSNLGTTLYARRIYVGNV